MDSKLIMSRYLCGYNLPHAPCMWLPAISLWWAPADPSCLALGCVWTRLTGQRAGHWQTCTLLRPVPVNRKLHTFISAPLIEVNSSMLTMKNKQPRRELGIMSFSLTETRSGLRSGWLWGLCGRRDRLHEDCLALFDKILRQPFFRLQTLMLFLFTTTLRPVFGSLLHKFEGKKPINCHFSSFSHKDSRQL